MTMPLKSLKEFNTEALNKLLMQSEYPHPNGIACPQCGAELNDLDNRICMSLPPQRNVGCLKCNWSGFRIA